MICRTCVYGIGAVIVSATIAIGKNCAMISADIVASINSVGAVQLP